jgi:DNA-binding phage protein
MIAQTTSFDPAAYIETPEAAVAYIDDALATGDAAFIADARDVLARAEAIRDQRPTA